jgi:competence protein ComGC
VNVEKLFILILAIAIAIFIALPFFRKRFEELPQEETNNSKNLLEEELRKLNLEKESLYAALKELDFDYSMGKLSKEDYEELDKKYKLRAASVLKEIDEVKSKVGTLDSEEGIEKEIKAVRETKLNYDEEIEKEILKARKAKN